jgi:hypothetical protein
MIRLRRRRSRVGSYRSASIKVMASISITETGSDQKVPEQIGQSNNRAIS